MASIRLDQWSIPRYETGFNERAQARRRKRWHAFTVLGWRRLDAARLEPAGLFLRDRREQFGQLHVRELALGQRRQLPHGQLTEEGLGHVARLALVQRQVSAAGDASEEGDHAVQQ